jgi:hypothetical protein
VELDALEAEAGRTFGPKGSAPSWMFQGPNEKRYWVAMAGVVLPEREKWGASGRAFVR